MYQRRYQIRHRVNIHDYTIKHVLNDMEYKQHFIDIPPELKYTLPIYIEVYDLQVIFKDILPTSLYRRVPKEMFDKISEHLLESTKHSLNMFTRFLFCDYKIFIAYEHVLLLRTLKAIKRQFGLKSMEPPRISSSIATLPFEDQQTAAFYLKQLVDRQSELNYEASKKIEDTVDTSNNCIIG